MFLLVSAPVRTWLGPGETGPTFRVGRPKTWRYLDDRTNRPAMLSLSMISHGYNKTGQMRVKLQRAYGEQTSTYKRSVLLQGGYQHSRVSCSFTAGTPARHQKYLGVLRQGHCCNPCYSGTIAGAYVPMFEGRDLPLIGHRYLRVDCNIHTGIFVTLSVMVAAQQLNLTSTNTTNHPCFGVQVILAWSTRRVFDFDPTPVSKLSVSEPITKLSEDIYRPSATVYDNYIRYRKPCCDYSACFDRSILLRSLHDASSILPSTS